ncbi:MAG TPA: NADH-quinone oxidoreductase subunit L [Acidimicrobiia bacterium]
MFFLDHIWIIPLLPAIGAAAMFFLGRKLSKRAVSVICVGATVLAFAMACGAALQYVTWEHASNGAAFEKVMYTWLGSGTGHLTFLSHNGPVEFKADVGFLLDPLSLIWLLFVTGVGMLIHIYSVGYMAHEGGYYRFFGYMNLFMFSMLTLVLGNNYPMLFVGWEGVGLCSYLLIGFFFHKPTASAAANKAFIVNRIGDAGFLMGMFTIAWYFGSFQFTTVTNLARSGQFAVGDPIITMAALLLFVGACGKSAQLPLYVWLPDAMEGPTPVSALIHAATMVTAGVYLVARSAAIFELSPVAQVTVATIGAATALWAASIAIAQYDIKKVLAYSTISQLGYMFMAVGATAYVAGIFHLMTHAFFKALLFLGAGSVIHAMSDEQDMRKMGGLLPKMRVTGVTMAIATLAIAGIPPLAGFWSKDEILGSLFERGGWYGVLWVVGLVTAAMTAFYMTRQWVMVFLGEPRWGEEVHPHESPRVMTVPLVALAVLTVVGGLVNTPFRLTLEHFLEPAFEGVSMQHAPEGWLMFLVLAAISVFAGLVGVAAAGFTYRRPTEDWTRFEDGLQPVWSWWSQAYRVDDFYDIVVVQPGKKAAEAAAFGVDLPIIDGAVNGVGRLTRGIGERVRALQTGQVRNYAALLFAGAIAIVVWLAVSGA